MAMEDMAIISLKNYDDALTAAKEKSGNSAAMTSAELAGRIRSIPGAKPEQEKTVSVTANGSTVVEPDPGKVMKKVTVDVDVPGKTPVVEKLTVTENGTYNPPSGVDGYKPVEVNVPTGGGGFPNGKEWTKSNITSGLGGDNNAGVAYADGLWLAGGDSGVYYSKDGKKWEKSRLEALNVAMPVYGNGVWVAHNARTGAYWSENGIDWTLSNAQGVGYVGNACCYANGVWVLLSQGKAPSVWSKDGKTWEAISNGQSGGAISYANGIWVASDYGLYWSEDGKTWNPCAGVMGKRFNTAANNANGIWVAFSLNESFWSKDGKTWEKTQDGFANVLGGPSYGNGVWVVSTNGGLYWSEDGKTWNKSNITSGAFQGKATYANGIWVVGDFSGKIYWSIDGKEWQGKAPTGGRRFSSSAVNANGIWVIESGNTSNGLYYSVTWEP